MWYNKNQMKKTLIFLLFCICLWPNLFGQSDSLKKAILNYQDPKEEIIRKGRKMILDKFLENDKKKVGEILDYLKNNEEDKDYLAFYPVEKWLIYFWTGEYETIIRDVAHSDSVYIKALNRKVLPPQDLLLQNLKEKLREQRIDIKDQIKSSKLNDTEKDFLILNFDFSLVDYDHKDITQDSLNLAANKFLLAYPNSKFEDFTRKYIRHEFKPSKWGYAFEFFSGYGTFTSNLGKNFKNNVPIGVAFDISYKNFILYLRGYIGFSKTTDSISFKKGTWRKGDQVRIFLPEASLGYVAFENKLFKMAPFVGISSTSVSPTDHDKDKIPEYKNVGLDFTTTYTFGFNIDFKLGKTNIPIASMKREESYWFIRIRYAYNKPQFDWKYSGFNGDFHYLTIGIGGFGRTIKIVN